MELLLLNCEYVTGLIWHLLSFISAFQKCKQLMVFFTVLYWIHPVNMETIVSGNCARLFCIVLFYKKGSTLFIKHVLLSAMMMSCPLSHFFIAVIQSLNHYGGSLRSWLRLSNKPVTPPLWNFVLQFFFFMCFRGGSCHIRIFLNDLNQMDGCPVYTTPKDILLRTKCTCHN